MGVDDGGNETEVAAKLLGACDRGPPALISEAVAALLGRAVGLPIPRPYLIRIEPAFSAAVPDATVRKLTEASLGWNFASEWLPPGFMPLPVGKRCPEECGPVAAEIFAFDAIIQNPDRRPENPNCLLKRGQLMIFDHELAFSGRETIGWKPPWEPDSLESMRNAPGRHLFFDQLRGRTHDLDRLGNALKSLGQDRLAAIEGSLPRDWVAAAPDFVRSVFAYLSNLLGKIPEVFMRVEEALR